MIINTTYVINAKTFKILEMYKYSIDSNAISVVLDGLPPCDVSQLDPTPKNKKWG
jgi:hypothetical protein